MDLQNMLNIVWWRIMHRLCDAICWKLQRGRHWNVLQCNNWLLLSRVPTDRMIDWFIIFHNRFSGMVVQILSSVWA